MESNKITTNNPLAKPNELNQKFVKVSDFNKLWDDTKAIDDIVSAGLSVPKVQITQNTNTTAPITLQITGVSSNLEQGDLLVEGIVTAQSSIKTVNYNGTTPIKYNIRRVGGSFEVADNEDPSIPYVKFLAADKGMVVLLEVWATAGMDSTYAVTYCEVQDNKGIVP